MASIFGKNNCRDISFVRYTSHSSSLRQAIALMYVNTEASSDEDVSFVRQGSASAEKHPDSASNDGLHLLEDEGFGDRCVVPASHPAIAVSDEEVDQLGPVINDYAKI